MVKIKTLLNTVKDFLEKYSIIIDFLNVVFTLILALVGLYLSSSALSISDKQLQIEEAHSQALISAEITYTDDASAILDITFVNQGGPVTDFTVQIVPYYDINYIRQPSEGYFNGGMVTIPMNDCFHPVFFVTNTNSKVGNLSSIGTTSAIDTYLDEMEYLIDYVTEQDSSHHIEVISLNYWILLTYTDYWGNEFEEYYDCITGFYKNEDITTINEFRPQALLRPISFAPSFRFIDDSTKVPSFVTNTINGDNPDCYWPIIPDTVNEDTIYPFYESYIDALDKHDQYWTE